MNPFRFSGKATDDFTGLVYYGFRWYDARLGKWISRDLINEEGGVNLYGMLGNDSINTYDILGLNSPSGPGVLVWDDYFRDTVSPFYRGVFGNKFGGGFSDFLRGTFSVASLGATGDIDRLSRAYNSGDISYEEYLAGASATLSKNIVKAGTLLIPGGTVLRLGIAGGAFGVADVVGDRFTADVADMEYWRTVSQDGKLIVFSAGGAILIGKLVQGAAGVLKIVGRICGKKAVPVRNNSSGANPEPAKKKPLTPAIKSALEEIVDIGPVRGLSKATIESKLRAAGFTSTQARSGGTVWTKSAGDGNTAVVRIDPPMVRAKPRGYADEVSHVHKEIVPTQNVRNGNYDNNPSVVKLDDLGNPSTDQISTHIPGGQ
jgi:RHS repeat-associated protein